MAEIEKSKAASETKSDKKPAKSKPSFFARIAKFFREYKAELKKVTWASGSDTLRNTIVVVVSVIIVGAVIGVLDFAFNSGLVGLGNLI